MSVKKVFALLEFLIAYFSRKHVAKLLLKLPASFFPNYRLVLNPVQPRNNQKARRMTLYEIRNSDNEESDAEEFHCNCRNIYYPGLQGNWKTIENLSAITELLPLCHNVTTSETPRKAGLGLKKKIFEHNLFATPPLRKITVEDLSSVKLRKSVNFPVSPRTPAMNDIIGVLRKRYVVMHSPNMLTNCPDSGAESDNSASGNSFCK